MVGRRQLLLIAVVFIIASEIRAADCPIPLQPTRTSFVTNTWIDGRGPFRFVVDTATSITVITPEVARAAGINGGQALDAISTTGTVRVERTTLPELRAGSVARKNVTALIYDLPRFRSHGRLDGILGMNFIGGSSYVLDVRGRCLDLDVPASEIGGGTHVQASVVADRVTLHVPAAAGQSLKMTLDSAASMMVLVSPRAQALAMRGEQTAVTSAAGTRQLESGVIPKLRIGDLAIRNVPAVMAPGDTGEDALVPVTLFSSVYVDASRASVILNGVRRVSAEGR